MHGWQWHGTDFGCLVKQGETLTLFWALTQLGLFRSSFWALAPRLPVIFGREALTPPLSGTAPQALHRCPSLAGTVQCALNPGQIYPCNRRLRRGVM